MIWQSHAYGALYVLLYMHNPAILGLHVFEIMHVIQIAVFFHVISFFINSVTWLM